MNSHFDERAIEMRALFFQSAQELLQGLNEQGLALEKDPANREAVREIRRLVHTLKGDSAACGLRELSELAHELEDVLMPEEGAANGASLPELVLSAADMFDAMCAAYRTNLEPPSGDPLRSLIWKLAQRTAAPTSATEFRPTFSWTEYDRLAMAEASGRGLRVYQIAAAIAPDLPMRAAGLELLKKVLQEAGTVLAVAPAEEDWQQAANIAFALASDRNQDWLADKCRIPGVVEQVVIEEFVPALELIEEDAAHLGTAPSAMGVPASPPDAPVNLGATRSENTLRIHAERIDNLLNLVGELVIGKSMLHQTLHEFTQRFPKDPLRAKFADAMAFQSQLLNALQRSAMKIRMVPVDYLFRRFPRLVRDLARLCGKQVAFDLSGQQTDLDKTLLDALAEPISHLLRNAVDHGIETPAQRRAAGKPEQATLRLHACHQGNEVVIEVSDDGRGIDPAAVLAKAQARGMLSSEQASRFSPSQAVDLIFEPGFSTAEQVSEISGRGIGMDVVKAATQKLKGSITVETQLGRGTTFRLRLPLTLAILRALLFRVSERLYAVPLESVIEITRAREGDIHQVDGHEVLQLRNDVLTLVRLNRLAPSAAGDDDGRAFVIVVGSGERKFGLVVDQLVGEEELVIKPLDDTVVATELVSGASVRGDGTVVLILNLSEVVRQFAKMAPPATAKAATATPAPQGRSVEATA